MDLLADLLASRPGGPESWTSDPSEAWRDLQELDHSLGGNTVLHELAQKRASALTSDADAKLKDLSGALAEVLFAGLESFERDLQSFLAQQTRPTDSDEGKPNTAAVVRIGQASRLARWLVVSGVNWPLLVIDEPTLGQDEASCARALVRYLRLMRKAEAARWLARRPEALEGLPAVLEKVTVGDLERWAAARLAGSGGEGSETLRSDLDLKIELRPLPPQAIVLSYREGALAVVADLEGTILDHQVRKNLQELIPECWHQPIGVSLRETYQKVESSLSSLLLEAGGSIPAGLLRAAWSPPLAQLVQHRGTAGWRKQATDALRSLGAVGIAEQVELEEDVDFRLLAWLLQADLLPAALADGDEYFQAGTLSLRRLPAEGGVAPEEGPIRLRRLLPIQDELPALPESWKKELARKPSQILDEPVQRTSATQPLSDWRVASRGTSGVERHRREIPPDDLGASPEPNIDPRAKDISKDISGEGTSRWVASSLRPRRRRVLWRVALVGGMVESFPAVAELVRLGVEASGLEAVEAGSDAEVLVDLRARELGLEPVECKWRLELPGGETDESSWEPQPAAIDRLLDSLVLARVRALEAASDLETPVEIVLATYNLREMPTRGAAFRFAVDLEAEDDPGGRRKRLEEVFSGGLKRLRARLAESPTTRNLRFYPRCGLSVGLRVGALFHRSSGFRVECEQNGEIWSTEGPGEPPADAVVEVVEEAVTGPELHVLDSISQEVLPGYQKWRRAGGKEGLVIRLAPSAGPGRQAILDADELAGWAALVPTVIASHRKDPDWPVRFFVSTPAALAVAIGRQLNAHGRIIAMEWDRQRTGYFEAFDFRT